MCGFALVLEFVLYSFKQGRVALHGVPHLCAA